jgi:hypothetical protein
MYPIDGTWMFNRESEDDWRHALGSFHAIGGTTVLQFGPTLTRSNPEKLRTDAPWRSAKHQDGSHDVDQVLQEIGEDNIGTWLTLDANESLGQELLLGPHDKELRLSFPVDAMESIGG